MARKQLRVVFFGTAEFAVPSLIALREAGHEILTVVTQPDKPTGRGMQVAASPIKKTAERMGLTVLQPRRVRSEKFLATMRELAPDVLALAAFGQIVPQALLDLPPLGPINVHGSLLPKYRGAAPIQRAIMAGETDAGVTTMWMDATLDTGDMLLAGAIPIAPDDTSGTLIPKLADLGARLLIETLEGLANGSLPRRPQNHAEATLAPALTPEDGMIRWREAAHTTQCRIRGVNPKPGAFAQIKGKRVKIWAASESEALNGSAAPGTLLALSKSPIGVVVACGNGTALRLEEVQPDSGKRMSALDWARGQRLAPGDPFDTLSE